MTKKTTVCTGAAGLLESGRALPPQTPICLRWSTGSSRWGSHSPFTWRQLSSCFLQAPHSRSSWNLVFLLSSAPLAEAFGDRSSGALGSDLARLTVHLVLSPAKIIHIIHTNINNCIPTQTGFVLPCLTLCLPSPNDLQKF